MIKIYYANIELLEEQEQCEIWFEKLHHLRKEKIMRCKQTQDQKRSLLAGILLKIALEQEGFLYEDVVFEVQKYGKTVLKSVDGYTFSISHAGEFVLCCISSQLVGADIEVREKAVFKEQAKARLGQMAKKVLSPMEYELFSQAGDEEKISLFLKYWTRKESYSKALGYGLQMDFSKIHTEEMEHFFWSDWLEKDCFVSVYAENDLTDIKVLRLQELKP